MSAAGQEPLDYGVPAYFHPAVVPHDWETLAGNEDGLRFVVVNIHNGVGADVDRHYGPVTRRLAASGVRLLGYIDTAYGRRPVEEIVEEHRSYRARYGISGVFLDQSAALDSTLRIFRECVRRLDAEGADFVALNPGTFPAAGYLELADITVCFEGTWKDYRRMSAPDWVMSQPRSRICHLVYETPAEVAADPRRALNGHHAQTVCFTDGRQPNPWDRLPVVLR